MHRSLAAVALPTGSHHLFPCRANPSPWDSHQTELIDQFTWFGVLVGGVWLIRGPQGSLLNAALCAGRRLAGASISASVALLEWSLRSGLAINLGA
jgi:hypothetical protein